MRNDSPSSMGLQTIRGGCHISSSVLGETKFRWNWHTFVFGAIGGFTSELVRSYKAYQESAPWQGHLSISRIAISVIFVIMSGIFAVAWETENPVKCLWIGLTFSTMVSIWMTICRPVL